MDHHLLLWFSFNLFILMMLILDLGVFHKDNHVIEFREAAGWSIFWISLAMLFNVGIYFYMGYEPALAFFTAYWIEKALSVDNLFVFLMIFSYFRVPEKYLHKVLFWGIFGAIIMRAIFIFAGIALIQQFHFIIYFFGALLIYTAYNIAFHGDQKMDIEKNPVLQLCRKFFKITKDYRDHKFFVKENGLLLATPLFIVLVAIETTDLIFAIDSIPAVLAITLDPFIVYTSNILAILGLRSLFFALSKMMYLFHLLNYGLAIILSMVGLKMLFSDIIKIPIEYTLLFVVCVLVGSVAGSLWFPKQNSDK